MFRFFKKREHPERRALRERFEKVMSRLRSEDPIGRAAVGHALNQANTFFIARFGSVAAFLALPSDDKKAYVEALTVMEKSLLEKGDLHSALGFALFGDWIAVVADGDEPLARQFKEGLAEVSRLGDAFLGPISPSPNQEPRPAGYDQMTEEQRMLSAKFIREQEQPDIRAIEDAKSAFKYGDSPKALSILQPLADRGNASAQYSLGVMYAFGQDQADFDRAHALYQSAARTGGHISLKPRYLNERVQPNFVLAYKWLSLAAVGVRSV